MGRITASVQLKQQQFLFFSVQFCNLSTCPFQFELDTAMKVVLSFLSEHILQREHREMAKIRKEFLYFYRQFEAASHCGYPANRC